MSNLRKVTTKGKRNLFVMWNPGCVVRTLSASSEFDGERANACLRKGIARVMNNFGVTDLRIVTPEALALAPPYDRRDADDRAEYPAEVCLGLGVRV